MEASLLYKDSAFYRESMRLGCLVNSSTTSPRFTNNRRFRKAIVPG